MNPNQNDISIQTENFPVSEMSLQGYMHNIRLPEAIALNLVSAIASYKIFLLVMNSKRFYIYVLRFYPIYM